MRIAASTLILSLLVACGGGSSEPLGALAGTLQIAEAIPQRSRPATQLTDAAGRTLAIHTVVADRAGRLGARIEGADDSDVVLCVHNLDTGECGRTVAVEARDACHVLVRAAADHRLVVEWGGEDERPAALPDAYWRGAGDCRENQLVVAPAPGSDGRAIARATGLDCLAESRALCLFRAPAEQGDARRRFRRLLARCARLEHDGLVRFAEPNYLRRLTATPDDPRLFDQWSLEQIRVQGLWEESIGSADVIVAVIDSGSEAGHPDMAGRFVDGYDFVDGDDDPHDTAVNRAHGTMVASIAAAATNNGVGMAGIAWGGRIMPLRVFDAQGVADSFAIAQAIRYAAGLDNSSGQLPARPALVANLSFVGSTETRSEEDACIAARAAGTLPVGASGNDGDTAPWYPAAYDSVLAVGATTRAGVRASYSNRGLWLSLMAPGGDPINGVLVADRNSSGAFVYREIQGTSFAAPAVSGIAALLMDLGALPPDGVQMLLEQTARDIHDPGIDDQSGYGIVDANAAVRNLLLLPPTPGAPGETIHVRLLRLDGVTVLTTESSDTRAFAWSLSRVARGSYRLVAGTDRDFDGAINDTGELFGEWTDGEGGNVIVLGAGETRADLSITLAPR